MVEVARVLAANLQAQLAQPALDSGGGAAPTTAPGGGVHQQADGGGHAQRVQSRERMNAITSSGRSVIT